MENQDIWDYKYLPWKPNQSKQKTEDQQTTLLPDFPQHTESNFHHEAGLGIDKQQKNQQLQATKMTEEYAK